MKAEHQTGKGLSGVAADTGVTVSLAANAWLIHAAQGGTEEVSETGLSNWSNQQAVFSAFIRVNQPGMLQLSLRAKVPSGASKIKVSVAGKSVTLNASGSSYHKIAAGNFNIRDTGYVRIDLQGISKSGTVFADATDLYVSGSAVNEKSVFIKDDIYWARRGPSVHLVFDPPAGKNIASFYSEITVPAGEDPIGSYYMANGFGEGYFGMQVNSATERRVLFSVWSPFETDDPKSIPDSMRISLLKKGTNVRTGEFGDEGSGGQSYLVFDWKAGNTYRFLTNAKPDDKGNTVYTSWFFAPELGNWQLIASFKRPKTSTYLRSMYSFLECFDPNAGYLGRKALYGNQWMRDTNNQWHQITAMRFSADATARAGRRLDYAGGVTGQQFYLQNCGFFSKYTPIGAKYSRTAVGQAPVIDFDSLP
ncbi:DUF3472 domain-containing protein [Pseudoflavitalea sp. G-6-1-2]|uniref:DUF3472 domain-containing protein n=1 Tax=Pseudoflavitalea sp. G-6-1-2 TaxID=2728841 RepID=UPI0019818E20|nr:DUF3472 domain-containing protein [Pseudoflavitalea sp. G-6-1-2]